MSDSSFPDPALGEVEVVSTPEIVDDGDGGSNALVEETKAGTTGRSD